jgi:hypothetical protein
MPLSIPKEVLGWISNHSRKNYWRVASFYEVDDLIQDGIIKAYEVINRYGVPGLEIDRPHYMALVKTSFNNHIVDLLRKYTPEKVSVVSLQSLCKPTINRMDGMDENEVLEQLLGGEDGDQEENMFVVEMPEYLRKGVQFFLSNPNTFQYLRKRLQSEKDESLSSKLARMVGFPEDFNFEEELRSYLWQYRGIAP